MSKVAPSSLSKTHYTNRTFGAQDNISEDTSCFSSFLVFCSYLLCVITFPFSLVVCLKIVNEYERAVIYRLGRLTAAYAKGPGLFFILPCVDIYSCVDLRTRYYEVPPQDVLTRDSVSLQVEAVIFYRIFNPTIATSNVENCIESVELLSQTVVRSVMGKYNMHDVLTQKGKIAGTMSNILEETTPKWGVAVERVEIKDVRLPSNMQKIMAAEAEAHREARAKIIDANAELEASRALKEASDVISGSSAGIQLRYLQTLNAISCGKTSFTVFPLPVEVFTHWLGKK